MKPRKKKPTVPTVPTLLRPAGVSGTTPANVAQGGHGGQYSTPSGGTKPGSTAPLPSSGSSNAQPSLTTGTSSTSGGSSSTGGGNSPHSIPTSSSPLSPVTIAALGLTQTEAGLVPYVLDAAAQNKVSPAMLMGLIESQSNFKPKARLGAERGLGMFGPESSHTYDVKHGDDPAAIKSQVEGLAQMLSDADVNKDPIGALNMWSRGDHSDFAEKVMELSRKFRPLDEALKPLATHDGMTQSVETARAARAAVAQGIATGGIVGARATQGYESDRARAVAEGVPLREGNSRLSKAERPAVRGVGAALGVNGNVAADIASGPVAVAVDQASRGIGYRAQALAGGAQPSSGFLGGPRQAGPKPRKVATRLESAVAKSVGTVPDYVPQEYRDLVADASKQYGVPAGILSALLQQESGFQAQIGSPAGAQGIAQFMPATAASRGVDPNDPKSAIPGAAELLKENKDQFGSWELALAAYNAGGGAVSEYGGIPPYPETQNYVKTIMGNAGDVSGGAAKDIPQGLIQRSKAVLGKPATEAILAGGSVTRDPRAGKGMQITFDGRYAGSQDLVRYLVGSNVKGDHGGTKNGEAPGVHDPSGDHYAATGYAQDINSPSGNAAENEPAFSQATLDTIYKNAKKLDPEAAKSMDEASGGNGLQMGTDWTGTIAGYQVQIFPGTEGSGPHIHIGARNTGEGQQSGTVGDPNVPVKGPSPLAVKPAPTTTAGGAIGGVGATTGSGAISGTGGWTPMMFDKNGQKPPTPMESTTRLEIPNLASAVMPEGFGGNFDQSGDLMAEEQSLIDQLQAAGKPQRRLTIR